MNILHVITRLTLGGSAENTISQVVALERRGYRCTLAVGVAGSETAVVEDARRRGCRVVDVPSLVREVAPWRDVRAVAALVRLIRRQRAAIVHTHTSKAGFVGRLAARLAGVRAVIHQPHGHIFYGYYGDRRTAAFVRLERLAARWSDRIVTLTERGTEEHLAQDIGRRAQYVCVPSGVPLESFRMAAPSRAQARERLGVGTEDVLIGAVGRLVPIKGFDLLVRALPAVLARAHATRLLLIGDGPDRDELDALARALGVERRLTITGATRDVPAYLAACDVLAAPSRNEGMGRVLVEAMALGIPVVGTTVGGIPSVVVDGECGLLVPADDVDALAAVLSELAVDPALRAKLGAAARVRAEAFGTDVAEARLLAVYEALRAAKGLR